MARYNNKRKQSLMMCMVSILLFIFGVTAGISYAYFSDSKNVTNTLNFGKLIISTEGETTTTVTLTPKQENGMTENGVYKIAANDTVSIAGSIGLEENSMPAYIRIKVEMFDQNSNNITGAFKTGFMAQMAEMIDPTDIKQWFVVGNYLYLGNEINAGNPFVFSESNTNTSEATAEKNEIKMTDEMLTNEVAGKAITITFTLQAIQSAGMGLTLSNYTQANATSISQLAVWQEIFGVDLNAIYSNEYATGYVRGTLEADGKGKTYTDNAQVGYQMTKSPYNYFKPSSDNTAGDYVAFGFYPQTIKDNSVVVKDSCKETFNGIEYYLGSDGYLYEQVKENANYTGYKYSDGTTRIKQASANSYKYFKLEPIIWQVLTESNGRAFLLSVSELTAMQFHSSNTSYGNSEIKTYLNGAFFNKAFTKAEQGKIAETTLEAGDEGYYDAETTYSSGDNKVFLLSANDLKNTNYFTDSNARIKYPTDYAGANYAYRSGTASKGGNWWSRSAGSSTSVWGVLGDGIVNNYLSPTDSYYGVVPALFLSI